MRIYWFGINLIFVTVIIFAEMVTATHLRASFRAYMDDVALPWTGKNMCDAESIVHAARHLSKLPFVPTCAI